MSRVLALDFGAARCGCAVTDPTRTIAIPIEPVLRPSSKRGMAALVRLVSGGDFERVIVGLPLSLGGGDSAQTVEAREFAQRLSQRIHHSVPVELYDERFTTLLAAREDDARSSEDSRAAAHLLEGWLAARGS